LWHLEQLHSEDIWHKDYSLFDKLFKPFVKVHGPTQRLLGWSIFALLAVEAVLENCLLMLVEVVEVRVAY
jgi:hypothetical protein